MGDLVALRATWPSLAGTTVQKLATLNAMTAPGPSRDVPKGQVWSYLAERGLLQKLEQYVAAPPDGAAPQVVIAANYLLALLADPNVDVLRTSQPVTMDEARSFIAALVADPVSGVSAAHGAALLAMAETKVPWWQGNGFNAPVNVSDLIEAGNLY